MASGEEIVLNTPRLILRTMRAEDVGDLLHIFGDPQVMASFGVGVFDRGQMERWVRRNLDHQVRHGYGLFSVILRGSGLLIGDCGLEHMEVEGTAETELGYDFRSDSCNRGLATEAASAVRDYAFGVLELPRLVSLIRIGNRASERVAQKIGMMPSRTIRRGESEYTVYRIDRPQDTAMSSAPGP